MIPVNNRFVAMILCLIQVLLAAFVAAGVSSPVVPPEKALCHVRWLTPLEHDFGEIEQGKPVTVTFRFQNEGTSPVLLQTARTTCGCTAAEWTEEPVAPGDEGTLKVEYDAYKRGSFRKKISVFFNCQKKGYALYIQGYVKKHS
jgi:hypothetical protein